MLETKPAEPTTGGGAAAAAGDGGGAGPPAAGPVTARGLYRHLIWLYVLGSLGAVVVTFFLGVLGLEYTLRQWVLLLTWTPVAVFAYVIIDILVLERLYRPLGAVLARIDRGERPTPQQASAGLASALNQPFYAFLRVTLIHGPLATLALLGVVLITNTYFAAEVEAWQAAIFAATVFFFSAPTHAIIEFFGVSRAMTGAVERIWPHARDGLTDEDRGRVISIRLRNKLLYLSIFITALPLTFFTVSVMFKSSRLLTALEVEATTSQMLPLWQWIVGISLVCVGNAFAMALLTAREVSRSAARLIDAMKRVESGDLAVDLQEAATDEYADLFRGFNKMTDSLRDEVRILEVTHDLSGEIHLDALLERIMGATTELLDADRSTLFLYDEETDELWSRFAEGLQTKEIRFPAGQGVAGRVFKSGQPMSTSNPYDEPEFNPEIDRKTGYRTESILCLPISNKAGRRIGVTQVLNKRNGVFTPKDMARLKAFTAQIAISLENARLFDDVLSMKNYNESVFESSSNGMITLDRQRRIVKVNDAALRILRRERAELEHQPIHLVFEEWNEWVVHGVERVEKTGRSDIAMDAMLELPGEEMASVNMTTLPLTDASDELLGTILIMEDITAERRVKATMARYMSKEVVDQLLEGGEAELGGKAQKVTVLFSDIRDFTTVSEALGARETVELLNEYFAEMVDVIFRHGGILDKYIGDAIMALFGAPFAGEKDADDAVRVAVEMLEVLAQLNARRAKRGDFPLDIGVGLCTGEVVVGNIGSPKRLEYTAIGDGVNLASRLEGANKLYGTKILLTDATVAELTEDHPLREIDLLRVKGRDEPAAVFEALGYHTEQSFPARERTLAAFAEGLAAYRARRFAEAKKAFETALSHHPGDRPSRVYVERCEHYLAAPPEEGWDGVWVMSGK